MMYLKIIQKYIFILVCLNFVLASCSSSSSSGSGSSSVSVGLSVSITADKTSVIEDDTSVIFTIRASEPISSPLSILYSTELNLLTATAVDDYIAKIGIIELGVTSQDATFSVLIISDTIAEPDEIFQVDFLKNPVDLPGHIASADYTIGSSIQVTIKNDDLPSIQILDAQIQEGDSEETIMRFAVSTVNQATIPANYENIRITYNTQDGTATKDVDYTAVVDATFDILNNETTGYIEIAIIGDEIFEQNEEFTVSISALAGDETVTGDIATGIIINDDGSVSSLEYKTIEIIESETDATFSVTINSNKVATGDEILTASFNVILDTAVTSDLVATTISKDVTIDSGSSSFAIEINAAELIENDEIVELAESFSLELVKLTGGDASITINLDNNSIAVTIIDDDTTDLSIIVPVSVVEGNDSGERTTTFQISSSAELGFDLSVGLNLAGTATLGIENIAFDSKDYNLPEELLLSLSRKFTIAEEETTDSITITILGDELVELDETIEVSLQALNSEVGNRISLSADASSATLTIKADDIATISFTPILEAGGFIKDSIGVGILEGNSGIVRARFTLTTDKKIDKNLEFSVRTEGDDLVADATDNLLGIVGGKDYVVIPKSAETFTLTAGELSTTFALEIIGDEIKERRRDEVFDAAIEFTEPVVYGSFITSSDASNLGVVNVIIIDDDIETISITGQRISEKETALNDNPTLVFTITAEVLPAENEVVTVSYEATIDSDDTAILSDIVGVLSGTATIDNNQTTTTIVIKVATDDIVERDEKFSIIIKDLKIYTESVLDEESISFIIDPINFRAKGIIVNDDTTDLSLSLVNTASSDITEAANSAFIFKLETTKPLGAEILVALDYLGTANNIEGRIDYIEVPEVTIGSNEGDTTANISIKVVDDAIIEGDETIIVSLLPLTEANDLRNELNPTGALFLAQTDPSLEVTIKGDNIISISIADATVDEGEIAEITFFIEGTTEAIIGFAYFIDQRGSPTATAAVDYVTIPTTLATIAAGVNPFVVRHIQTIEDNEFERDETFRVSIPAVDGTISGKEVGISEPLAIATITIIDDEQLSMLLQLVGEENEVTEGKTISFTVTASTSALFNIPINYSIALGSNGSPKTTDYLTSEVILTTGQQTTTINVTAANDTIIEETENFTISINDSNKHTGSDGVDFTIANSTEPNLSIELEETFREGATGTFVVSLVNQTTEVAITANYTISSFGITPVTANDFLNNQFPTGTVSIAANQQATAFNLTTKDDNEIEINETFRITLSDIIFKGADVTEEFTIVDNDFEPVRLSLNAVEVAESATTITGTIETNAVIGEFLEVSYSITNITTEVEDYIAVNSASINLTNNNLSYDFNIIILDDEIVEADEQFEVAITISDTNIAGISTQTRQVITIKDNDTANLTISGSDLLEGGEANTYKVILNTATEVELLGVYTVEGTGVNPTVANDFVGAVANQIIFPEDSVVGAEQTFTLQAANVDNVITNNNNKEFTFSLTNNEKVVDNNQYSFIIQDDDNQGIKLLGGSITEGESANVGFNLKDFATDVTVSYKVELKNMSELSATADTADFSDLNFTNLEALGSVTLSTAGTTLISINTVDDAIIETNQTFLVTITATDPPTLFAETPENNRSVLVTINDNDTARIILTSASENNEISEGTGANSMQNFTISLSEQTTEIDLNLLVTVIGTREGTNSVAGDDFVDGLPEITAQIVVDSTTSSFAVEIVGDDTLEYNESFTFNSNIETATKIASFNIANSDNTATNFLIINDDTVTMNITPTISTVEEGNANTDNKEVQYTVTATGSSAINIPFSYNVTGDNDAVDKAEASDFTTSNGTIANSFAELTGYSQIEVADLSSDTVTITINGDAIFEAEEGFIVELGNNFNTDPDFPASGINFENSAKTAITNDDSLALSINDATAVENNNLDFIVSIVGESEIAIPFSYEVTATGDSPTDVSDFGDGTDSDFPTGMDSITKGLNPTGTISISINDDNKLENDETFQIKITTTTTGVSISNATAIATIINNDLVTLTLSSAGATEGDPITITVSGFETEIAIPFSYVVTSIGDNPATASDFGDGTASDFPTGEHSIAARSSNYSFTIATYNDDFYERGSEQFLVILTLANFIPANLVESLLVTILDNDSRVVVDGDNDGLIDIFTAEEFYNIRYNLEGTSYKTTDNTIGLRCGSNNDISCDGYELHRNIDLSNFANWLPIQPSDPDTYMYLGGSVGEDIIGGGFSATFDGNAFTISNLSINRSSDDYIGMFSVLDGATIRNLVIKNPKVAGDIHVGALAGSIVGSTNLENVGVVATNSQSLISVSVTGTANVGGLIGYARVSNNVTNSWSSVSVTGTTDMVGGLIGRNIGGLISNSWASGSVTATNFGGGLVGIISSNATTINSWASGSVTAANFGGGLVGYNGSQIITSWASGSVTGSSNLGGLTSSNIASGQAQGATEMSYWNSETSGSSTVEAGGTGVTTNQMFISTGLVEDAAFSDWAITDTSWDFGELTEYPTLISNTTTDLQLVHQVAGNIRLANANGTGFYMSDDNHQNNIEVQFILPEDDIAILDINAEDLNNNNCTPTQPSPSVVGDSLLITNFNDITITLKIAAGTSDPTVWTTNTNCEISGLSGLTSGNRFNLEVEITKGEATAIRVFYITIL